MALFTSVNPDTNKEKAWGSIAPYANYSYPVFISANNRGGQVSVSSINASTIPPSHEEEGMIAYQESNGTHYKLQGSPGSYQWSEMPANTSNGLWTYKKYAMDANGTVAEMYKWNDGRLEYFIQYVSRLVNSPRYEFYTLDFPRYYFPQKFISSGDPIARSTAVKSGTGVVWADTYIVTNTYVLPRAMGTTSSSRAIMHVVVEGRWK